MANIIDYIKWRGDFEFEKAEFNEMDSAILARFSYLPFDTIIKENEVVTIKELSEKFKKADKKNMRILWEDDPALFEEMGKSARFGNLKVGHYINKYDREQEKQFAAITIFLPNGEMYISFRGTDATIVGWKEDFNMSFKSHIASQISAKEYLEEIVKKYPKNKIRLGGHSKGGNVAMYASIFCNQKLQQKIIKVDNYDGPGFMEEITITEEYKKIIERIHTYIPDSSIIGRLMEHQEKCTILQSNAKGIMQHDIYSWQVEGKEFIKAEKLSNQSDFIDKTITDWLGQVEPKEREKVVDVIFSILYKTDETTFKGIRSNFIKDSKIMLNTYQSLDEKTKKMVIKASTAFIKIASSNAQKNMKKNIQSSVQNILQGF